MLTDLTWPCPLHVAWQLCDLKHPDPRPQCAQCKAMSDRLQQLPELRLLGLRELFASDAAFGRCGAAHSLQRGVPAETHVPGSGARVPESQLCYTICETAGKSRQTAEDAGTCTRVATHA